MVELVKCCSDTFELVANDDQEDTLVNTHKREENDNNVTSIITPVKNLTGIKNKWFMNQPVWETRSDNTANNHWEINNKESNSV